MTRARAARTGVYEYTGREVDPTNKYGLRDKAIVNVLRDDSTVFDKAAARSFIGKPVTDNHPSVSVNSANWKEHARGTIMGALRDGEYLSFDLLITDAATIRKIEAGKRSLSNGYAAKIEYGQFQSEDGIMCDARQAKIICGNHIAVVDQGRAGADCRIVDNNPDGGSAFAVCDANPDAIISTGDFKMKIVLDGVSFTLTDVNEIQAAFDKIKADAVAASEVAAAALADAKDEAVKLAADAVAKDAEIAKLAAQVADAEITPAKLREAAKAYADAKGKAAAFGVEVEEEDDAHTIKSKVVAKKMGDAAKDYTADHIAIAFDALTKSVVAAVVPIGPGASVNDALSVRDQAYENYKKSLNEKAA